MSTPLQIAVFSCHVSAIMLLIEHGADTSVPLQIPLDMQDYDADSGSTDDEEDDNKRRYETIRFLFSHGLKTSLLDPWSGKATPMDQDPSRSYTYMGVEGLRAIKEIYPNITAEEAISDVPRRNTDADGIMELFDLSVDAYVALFMPRTVHHRHIDTHIRMIYALLQDGYTVTFTKEDIDILHDKYASYGTYHQGLMLINAIIRDGIVKIEDDAKPAAQRLSDTIKRGNYNGNDVDYEDMWRLFY